MFISRPAYQNELSAHIAITMESIAAGQREVAEFCAGTSLATFEPKRHFTGRATPVDDLSWWKPFLQLRGPESIAGPAEARRLFNRGNETPARTTVCIDHSEDDVPLPSFNAASASIFTTMRNRQVMPAYHDDRNEPADDDESVYVLSAAEYVADADVVAERVTAPVELRFFPQRTARAPAIVDC